jgi:hypothetical protein
MRGTKILIIIISPAPTALDISATSAALRENPHSIFSRIFSRRVQEAAEKSKGKSDKAERWFNKNLKK